MAWAVRFEGVSKRYRGGGPRYGSLRHDLVHGVRRLGQLFSGRAETPQGRLALDDVSFEVEQGESFAIIGPNGAGKTTALKLMSRISYPSAGRIRVRGRVGALIEVGSGVHPELNARENIWLYGQMLGMSRAELRNRFEEIVEFAELSDVLETPVKMYSSGMQLRLGFAIASHLDPEIFVVDEALAVGDAGFQAKCVERMARLVTEGRTLLFVSHNLSAVEAICRRGAFLLAGKVVASGEARHALRAYLDWIDSLRQDRLAHVSIGGRSKQLVLERLSCADARGQERYAFRTGEEVEIRLHLYSPAKIPRPYVSVGISDGRPGTLVLCSMLVDGGAPESIEGRTVISCRLRSLPLLPRVYELWCSVRSAHAYGDLLDWQQVGAFRVVEAGAFAGPAAQVHTAIDGPVFVAHDWSLSPCQ